MLYHVMSDVMWNFHDMSHYFTCQMSWNRDFTQHGTFMLSCYVMLSWYAMLCHDVMLLNMLLCYVIICNLFMLCYVVVLCHVMNYYVMLSCYDMSFCNVMMSCYAEVVKQVTVLVVITCESVHSHLLLSPCTALELATCTVQFLRYTPIPVLRFCFNWLLKEEENWVPHEPTKQKWSQISGNSTILTKFLSFWYRKFTFWYYSQNFVNIIDSTQNWHPIGCSSLSWNTGDRVYNSLSHWQSSL